MCSSPVMLLLAISLLGCCGAWHASVAARYLPGIVHISSKNNSDFAGIGELASASGSGNGNAICGWIEILRLATVRR